MTTPTLIYFAARGRAELIRLILAEAGVDYTEHPVSKDKGSAPISGRPTDFAALKASGQLAFDAVPVWEEPDGSRLAQSVAIANSLARRYGLMGKTERQQALVEQAIGGYEDMRAEFRKLAAAPPEHRPAVREELLTKSVPRWLGAFARLLAASGGEFLVGELLTSADLALWYLVEMSQMNGFGGAVAKFPALEAHFARIGKRPKIAAYLASSRRPAFVPLPK